MARAPEELDDELRFHLEKQTDLNIQAGMSTEQARRKAMIEFGGVQQTREAIGEQSWSNRLDLLWRDVRFGLRMLRKSPGFAAVAVITLALGIGANTAIFSIVDAVLLRPLPFPEADRLVRIVDTANRVHDVGASVDELEDLRSRSGIFQDVSVTWPFNANLTGVKRPERLEVLVASPSYFSMLGAKAQLGRVFGPQEQATGFAEAIVISDSLWHRSYGGDPNIVGKRLLIDNDPYTIVGVLQPGFRHPGRTVATDVEVWTTAGFITDPFPPPKRIARMLPGAIGRLRSGLSLKEAQASLDVFVEGLKQAYPTDYPPQSEWKVELQPLQEALVGDVRPMLVVLMGAVALIVLMASVNIANLLLARASSRQREVAVRLALGASRGTIVRQLLTESITLSLLAGAVGTITAYLLLRSIALFVPARTPRLSEVGMDWRILLFALAVSLITGILFGLAPALQAAKMPFFAAVREGAQGGGYSKKTGRLRGLLVGSELALAVVLMVGAGLLLKTFWGLLQADPGFNASRVVGANIRIPQPNDPKMDKYPTPERTTTFRREVLSKVRGIPGVEGAELTSALPITRTAARSTFYVEGRTDFMGAEFTRVTPGYFKLMEVPHASGREFTEDDVSGKPLVLIVDETAAKRFWPDQDPVGKRLAFVNGRNFKDGASAPTWLTVVGVVRNVRDDGLDARPVPHVYGALYQATFKEMSLVVRTSLTAAALEPQVRKAVEAVDPELPVFGVSTMEDVIGASLSPRRFSAQLVGAFALLATLLASVGTYGLLAYIVRQRSLEIGVRMALGAQTSDIRKMVLKQGMSMAGAGISVGLVAAGVAAPTISAVLYGVHPLDAMVFGVVPLVLLVVALAACYVPALRAARVDPLVAMRGQ